MIDQNLLIELSEWEEEAKQYLIKGNYSKARTLYEQAIATEPENKSHYWNLGLMLLLQGEEEEAQTTWLLAMAEGEPEQLDFWVQELIQVLETEADRRVTIADYSVAWAIRHHIRELNPTDINNLLQLIDLSIETELYTGDELTELGIIEILESDSALEIDQELLLHVLQKILNYAAFVPSSFEFTKVCATHIKEPLKFVDILIPFVYEMIYSSTQASLAIRFCEIGLSIAPKNPEIVRAMAGFYLDISEYTKGIEYAKLRYSLTEEMIDKAYDNHVIIKAIMNAGGYWEELHSLIDRQKQILKSLIEEQPSGLGGSPSILRLYNSTFFFPYYQDNPQTNIKLRQQIAKVCQSNIDVGYETVIERYRQAKSPQRKIKKAAKPLKIGYLSHCLRRHSVGWLTRGLFQHYDPERFEFYVYMLASKQEDPLNKWYIERSTKAEVYGLAGVEVAEKIYEDGIDILVELDSITLNVTCGIMALKPAPVQATWLGWDASEIPTIDYYIADPYVLPENADDYYSEKIWRLPQTYLAVDGFEVSVPTLRRELLDIPSDAIIYFSSQRGPKYNPHTVRLQMQILKEVPNSYFLIKGYGEQESLNRFFLEIAEAEGMAGDRLRFLSRDDLEEIHRANLGIADVVLDTYPYNGATTTMETLWMCIPMVTRVGEQFAARNSYTMMMNAGITEGIAWSDEEYVEWGIKLGKYEKLRQEISWKLRKSKQTAPLWNAKQFTREMEKAYEGMWQRYIEGEN
ncbi:MAG: tetratricopeptide repeat protein [Okeania sp. SIO3B3]|nr:tetratricopeptide repeat protein [Okeania sp. SIO3B3]